METGERIAGRFELAALVGQGGMGRVYRAHDRVSGEVVAVKIMSPPAPEEQERFFREAELLARIHHPHVVRYVAHGPLPWGDVYIAMEWLDGEDLRTRLKRGPLPLKQVLSLARRLTRALGALHALPVVHRDLKPANVFLVGGRVDRLRILDLGVARVSGAGVRSLTGTGVLVGTPAYMAPEQARADADVDHRADLFALGAVLYECVSGRMAFPGASIMEVIAKVLLDAPTPLPQLTPQIPPALTDLIDRLLGKERDKRPPTAEAVASELDAIALSEGAWTGQSEVAATLGRGERRVASVLVAVPAAEPSADGFRPTMPGGGSVVELRSIARTHHVDLVALADSTLLGTVSVAFETPQDLAVRAARCAVALQQAEPTLRVAVATGRRLSATVAPAGELIERALSLLGRPAAEGIVIDETTASLVAGRVPVRRARGLAMLAPRKSAGSDAPLARVGPACLGRDREVAFLTSYFDECVEEGIARVALVTGEPGVGKTRLAKELLGRIEQRGGDVAVWTGAADPMGAGAPFGLVARAVRDAAGLRDGGPLPARHEKLRVFSLSRMPGERGARLAELLGELVGAPFPDEASQELRAARRDPQLMGDRLRAAFGWLIAAETARRPLVLVLEDMHWGDAPSVGCLDAALRDQRDRPFLIIALARPEVHALFPGLWAERGLQILKLEGLRPRAAEALAREVLGESANDGLVQAILERAGGNPFVIEELARARREEATTELPESVLGMAQARLDRLSSDARRILRAASVFGLTFWGGGVRALCGGSEREDVDRWLDALSDMEVVVPQDESRYPGERQLVFRHALLREAVYATLTDEDRTLGHRLAAQFLESKGETEAGLLAQHHELGGTPLRAAHYYLSAARDSLDGNDLAGAIERAKRGLAGGAEGELAGHLRLVLSDALRWQGDRTGATATAWQALAALPPGSNAWYWAVQLIFEATSIVAEDRELERLADELSSMPPPPPGVAPGAVAALVIAASKMIYGDRPERGLRLLDHASRIGEPLAPTDPWVAAQLATGSGLRGVIERDVVGRLDAFEEAARCWEQVGDLRNTIRQRVNHAYSLTLLGSFARAAPILFDARDASVRLGSKWLEMHALNNLGYTLSRLGRNEEAIAAEQEAIAYYVETKHLRLEGGSRIYLAEALQAHGDLDAAREVARRAVELLEVAPPLRPYARAVLARVELARGDIEASLAEATIAERSMRSDVVEEGEAAIALALAAALNASGRPDEARRVAREGKERLFERAQQIRNRELRESYLTNMWEHRALLAIADG